MFYATVIGQANVTICDFFGFGHLDGLGSRRGATDNYNFDIPWGPQGMLGRLGKVCPRALLA